MKKFIYKSILTFILIYSINLLFGYLIFLDGKNKSEIGIFYPPKRWKEFYEQPKNSLNVIFLGASLCNKCYNPKIFDQHTNQNSFNMGSSIQTITTSYFVLKEILKYQNPDVVFLDLFTRSFNYPSQLEGVRYNLNNMRFSKNWLHLFWMGLSFKEKIAYIFPVYSMRDQLNRIIKFKNKNIDTTKIFDLYDNKGYVSSTKRLSIFKLKAMSSKRFNWVVNKEVQRNMHYLNLIISKCKNNNIELILINAPIPKLLYHDLDIKDYEKYLTNISEKNNIVYLNLNKIILPIKDTVHFKDHHLNKWGAEVVTKYIANYYKKNIMN